MGQEDRKDLELGSIWVCKISQVPPATCQGLLLIPILQIRKLRPWTLSIPLPRVGSKTGSPASRVLRAKFLAPHPDLAHGRYSVDT